MRTIRTLSLFLIVYFLTTGVFAQSKSVISCKIWKPESFCNIPDSLITIPRVIKMDSASVSFTTCENIDNTGNMTGIWLTLSKKDGSVLKLESNFRNITLNKKGNKGSIHPYAILWPIYSNGNGEKDLRYMTSDMETNHFEAKFSFQNKIDLILIFPGAEKGDKIIIDDFVEAIVQE